MGSRKLTIEWSDLVDGSGREYRLFIPTVDMALTNYTDFDKALFADINNDPEATIADRLLGLETLVRRIEEASNPIKEIKETVE